MQHRVKNDVKLQHDVLEELEFEPSIDAARGRRRRCH